MRTAVIRVNLDPGGDLASDQLAAAAEQLRASGLEVIAPDFAAMPASAREIELLLPGEDTEALSRWAAQRCAEALREVGALQAPGALGPAAGPATFLSRGTDEDALGVIGQFGVTGQVARSWAGEEEVVTVTIPADQARRAPESRLHTALEAALNCEVRIVFA